MKIFKVFNLSSTFLNEFNDFYLYILASQCYKMTRMNYFRMCNITFK